MCYIIFNATLFILIGAGDARADFWYEYTQSLIEFYFLRITKNQEHFLSRTNHIFQQYM